MILYLIHDLQQNTYSHPLVGPDLPTVNKSLYQLNPENLADLKVLVLDTLETLDDLKYLRVQKEPLKPKYKSKYIPKSTYVYDDPKWQAEASIRSKAVHARTKLKKSLKK